MKQAGKLLRSKQKNTEPHDSNDIKKILLHNNDFIKKNISCIEVLYCKKSSLRDNSGWNVILKINTADIDFSKMKSITNKNFSKLVAKIQSNMFAMELISIFNGAVSLTNI